MALRQHTPIQNMETLFGKVLLEQSVMILNEGSDSSDQVKQLLQVPKGHPPINNFLGIPFTKDDTCIGSTFDI